MSEIKTGLWQNTLDGSFIKVTSVLENHITYSDEGCAVTHVMNKRELIGCYRLVEGNKPALVGKSTSTRLEKIIQAAIEIRTELNLLEDSAEGGEIQWAEAMTEPVNKLVVALNQYQTDDTFNDDDPRVWININDDSCINVSHIGSKYAYYSEEGSSDSHSMDVKYFAENYRLAGIGEKLEPVVDIAVGSPWLALKDLDKVEVTGVKVFDDGVDDVWFTKNGRIDILTRDKFLSTHTPLLIDDTFNDDTPAQTFSDIKWDEGVGEKCVRVAVCLTCDAKMPEDSLDFYVINQGLGCLNCKANAGKKYMTRVPNVWRRDEKKVGAADKMRLIGIAGPARAGKDTLCSYMLDNLDGTWLRSSFADPLKEMLRVLGVDCSDDAKAVISDDYGVTPRHMMQTLGTEWGRNLIDGDIWVKAFARLNAGKCVIVPDVRFENEANLVREHGVLIHLVGRGGIEGNHVSENAIDFKPGDIVIDNSRDLAWLHGQVDGNDALSDFIAEISE